MDAYALHLAMAALVGASFVAVSAYYMHCKTLTQLLEFARAVEKERERDRGAAAAGDEEERKRSGSNPPRRIQSQYRRKGMGYYQRGSTSLPDVKAAAGAIGVEIDGEEEEDGEMVWNGSCLGSAVDLLIPPGLPRLRTVPEGNKQSFSANSIKRTGHVIKSTSPKSAM